MYAKILIPVVLKPIKNDANEEMRATQRLIRLNETWNISTNKEESKK
jgi:hypothetical protein